MDILEDLEILILNNEDDFDRGKGKYILQNFIKEKQAEQLNLSVVVPSACNFYMSGMDTSSKCNNCGKPEHLH